MDTDASIKLTKINVMEIVASGFDVILTEQVYKEQVTAGLERNLPDAKRMEKLVHEGKNGLFNKEKGLKYLELLKPMIKEEHMFFIKSKIEELK